MDTLAARQQMVDQQIRTWEVLDPRVLDALVRGAARGIRARRLPRARVRRCAAFPSDSVNRCSRPRFRAASCRRWASTHRTARSKIGTGTGYLSACLSLLVRRDAFDRHSCRIHGRCSRQPARRAAGAGAARNARRLRPGAVGRVRRHRRHRVAAGVRRALRARAARRRPVVRRGRLGAGHGRDAGAPGRSDRMDSREPVRDRHRPA